jgi:TP53 regulating kinase-like protein
MDTDQVNDPILMHRGAEADLYLTLVGPWKAVLKKRVEKKYRQKDLDVWIRKERTTKEATMLGEARKAGVRTPTLLRLNPEEFSLTMSLVQGKLARDSLDLLKPKVGEDLFLDLGHQIGKLHRKGIVHGDLTTSNLIISEENTANVIDFGLASSSIEAEDRAVDLHLLRRSIATSHSFGVEKCFRALSKGYTASLGHRDSASVYSKASEIARRGRYFAIR